MKFEEADKNKISHCNKLFQITCALNRKQSEKEKKIQDTVFIPHKRVWYPQWSRCQPRLWGHCLHSTWFLYQCGQDPPMSVLLRNDINFSPTVLDIKENNSNVKAIYRNISFLQTNVVQLSEKTTNIICVTCGSAPQFQMKPLCGKMLATYRSLPFFTSCLIGFNGSFVPIYK